MFAVQFEVNSNYGNYYHIDNTLSHQLPICMKNINILEVSLK